MTSLITAIVSPPRIPVTVSLHYIPRCRRIQMAQRLFTLASVLSSLATGAWTSPAVNAFRTQIADTRYLSAGKALYARPRPAMPRQASSRPQLCLRQTRLVQQPGQPSTKEAAGAVACRLRAASSRLADGFSQPHGGAGWSGSNSQKPAANQELRYALERRGFVVDAVTVREDGTAISARRYQQEPFSKAA